MKYNKIFQNRNLWMGIAILWIMLFHSGFNIPVVNYIKAIGYGGVDIFLFASGVGCYFSLKHDSNNFNFIKRRMKRILPTYFTFLIFWFLYKILVDSITLKEMLANIFCVGWMIGLKNQFNWYINGIWILYILTPFLFSFISQKSQKKAGIVILIMLLVSIPFWNTTTLMLVTRLPIYFIGIYFASQGEKNTELSIREFIVYILLMCFGFIILFLFLVSFDSNSIWKYGLWWYPFIFITPGICLSISFIADYSHNKICEIVKQVISFIGKYTFEIYLVHISVYDIFGRLIQTETMKSNNFNWLVASLVVIFLSFLLVKCTKIVIRIFRRLIIYSYCNCN